MKIYALVDEDYEGDQILFLSENKQTLENKKLSIEVTNDKIHFLEQEYDKKFNEAAAKRGFDVEEEQCNEFYETSDYHIWSLEYYENNPHPDMEDYIWVSGNLVIKEYETI